MALYEQRGESFHPDQRSGKTSWPIGVRRRPEWKKNLPGRDGREGKSTVLLRFRYDLSVLLAISCVLLYMYYAHLVSSIWCICRPLKLKKTKTKFFIPFFNLFSQLFHFGKWHQQADSCIPRFQIPPPLSPTLNQLQVQLPLPPTWINISSSSMLPL